MQLRHENRILNASEFISLTDNTPLSGMLTYRVMDTVAVELGDWLGGQRVSPHEHQSAAANSAEADSSTPRPSHCR